MHLSCIHTLWNLCESSAIAVGWWRCSCTNEYWRIIENYMPAPKLVLICCFLHLAMITCLLINVPEGASFAKIWVGGACSLKIGIKSLWWKCPGGHHRKLLYIEGAVMLSQKVVYIQTQQQIQSELQWTLQKEPSTLCLPKQQQVLCTTSTRCITILLLPRETATRMTLWTLMISYRACLHVRKYV